jgi:hypothetical protein
MPQANFLQPVCAHLREDPRKSAGGLHTPSNTGRSILLRPTTSQAFACGKTLQKNTQLWVLPASPPALSFTPNQFLNYHKFNVMRKKILALLSVLMLILAVSTKAQTTFYHKDIEGIWKSTAGYSIRIRPDGIAILSSLGNTRFPQKLLGNTFYANINHSKNNVWTATRFQWKYEDGNMENGRWANEGTVELHLSNDKNTFTEGPRTFNRTED